jgi:hypothetical protein
MSCSNECVEDINHPKVLVGEKGRKAVFLNSERAQYLRIHVDGCLIKDDSTKKSDFIVTKKGVGSVVVELKGKDLRTARQQLFATLDHEKCCCWLEKRKAMLIVCSRVPAFTTSDANFKEECRRRGLRCTTVCNEREVHIEDLLGIARNETSASANKKGRGRADGRFRKQVGNPRQK